MEQNNTSITNISLSGKITSNKFGLLVEMICLYPITSLKFNDSLNLKDLSIYYENLRV